MKRKMIEYSPIPLEKRHIKKAGRILCESFKDNPLWKHLIPNPDKRENEMVLLWELFVRYGIKYGRAFVTSKNVEGVSLWTSSQYAKMTFWRQFRCGGFKVLRKLGVGFLKRSNVVNKTLSLAHEKYAPPDHWYLLQLAVDPNHRGKGFAGKLLRDFFAQTKKDQKPYYLETGVKENVSMYQHLGFEAVGTIIIPKIQVKMWFMVRE